jgi:hypothetical protein
MKKKLLKLLGFKYCIICGEYKFFGKVLRWRDDPDIEYKAFTCDKCRNNYREE